jgi:hypothetical protein
MLIFLGLAGGPGVWWRKGGDAAEPPARRVDGARRQRRVEAGLVEALAALQIA